MRVLGIDPGSETTGWGVVEGDARRYAAVDFGTVKANPRERFPARLLKIALGVEALIEKFRPDVCAVEEAFFAVNPKTALKLGHVRGVVLLAGSRAGLAVHEYPPATVKQQITGFGRAEKSQVAFMVTRLLALETDAEPGDATDALAVALCFACLRTAVGALR